MNAVQSADQIIQHMRDGAILCCDHMGASTWSFLDFPDGSSISVQFLNGLERSDLLEPFEFDERGVPTKFRLTFGDL